MVVGGAGGRVVVVAVVVVVVVVGVVVVVVVGGSVVVVVVGGSVVGGGSVVVWWRGSWSPWSLAARWSGGAVVVVVVVVGGAVVEGAVVVVVGDGSIVTAFRSRNPEPCSTTSTFHRPAGAGSTPQHTRAVLPTAGIVNGPYLIFGGDIQICRKRLRVVEPRLQARYKDAERHRDLRVEEDGDAEASRLVEDLTPPGARCAQPDVDVTASVAAARARTTQTRASNRVLNVSPYERRDMDGIIA